MRLTAVRFRLPRRPTIQAGSPCPELPLGAPLPRGVASPGVHRVRHLGDRGLMQVSVRPRPKGIVPGKGTGNCSDCLAQLIDSFTRDIDDDSTHSAQGTTFDWGSGQRIDWLAIPDVLSTGTHYDVQGGRGRIVAMLPHYSGNTLDGDVDKVQGGTATSDQVNHLLVKFRISRREKIVNGDIVAFVASSDGPQTPTLVDAGLITDIDNDYSADEATPDFDTQGGITGGTGSGQIDATLTFQPDATDTGYGAITGTVVCTRADDLTFDLAVSAGGFTEDDPSGFIPHGGIDHSATPPLFYPVQLGGVTWDHGTGGLRAFSPVNIAAIFYTATDTRDPWPNKVQAFIAGGNWDRVTIDRSAGGSGDYHVSTLPYSSPFDLDTTEDDITLEPDTDYYLHWYRPNQFESYVRIWAVGDTEPSTWLATALDPASDLTPEQLEDVDHTLSIGAHVYAMQQYSFDVDEIRSLCP